MLLPFSCLIYQSGVVFTLTMTPLKVYGNKLKIYMLVLRGSQALCTQDSIRGLKASDIQCSVLGIIHLIHVPIAVLRRQEPLRLFNTRPEDLLLGIYSDI